MTLGEQLAIVVSETGLLIDQCRACERQGLPILPLRQALVPDHTADPFLTENGQFQTRLGWRTLRAGYLYVLLDRSIWHAYQVTPDGYLRQFSPYTPPASNDSLLASACVSADHDAPASFLNIDTHEHRVAWLAFASDPWPTCVLDAYKAGHASHRFQALDLAQARDNPASLGLAMTAESLQVDERVLEYQSLQAGQFPSVHGVYPRALRCQALRGFLRNTTARQGLQQGCWPSSSMTPSAWSRNTTPSVPPGFMPASNGWKIRYGPTSTRPRRSCWPSAPSTVTGQRRIPRPSNPSAVTAPGVCRPWS